MGSGKTTVGKIMARSLGYTFSDFICLCIDCLCRIWICLFLKTLSFTIITHEVSSKVSSAISLILRKEMVPLMIFGVEDE
jgi:hypothetical protein